MANVKMIAVAAAAIALVAGVTISFSSYLGEFDDMQTSTVNEQKVSSAMKIPVLGSGSAPITIIEIGDYQCEMCKKWFEETRPQLIENYVDTGKASFMFIDLPFLGQHSYTAADASYCADDQGKYWEYHAKLYELQQHVDDGWASADRLNAIAFSLDLDMETFEQCTTSAKHMSTIQENKNKAERDYGANSTPTFIIANSSGDVKKIVGAYPYSTFEEIINSLL